MLSSAHDNMRDNLWLRLNDICWNAHPDQWQSTRFATLLLLDTCFSTVCLGSKQVDMIEFVNGNGRWKRSKRAMVAQRWCRLPKKCVGCFWLVLTRHFHARTDGQTKPVKSGLESRRLVWSVFSGESSSASAKHNKCQFIHVLHLARRLHSSLAHKIVSQIISHTRSSRTSRFWQVQDDFSSQAIVW